MRKAIFFLLMLMIAGLLQAQQSPIKDQQAVQETVKNVFAALSNRDSMGMKKYCTSDVLFFEYGQTWTIDSLIKKGVTQNQVTDFKRVNTLEFINTAINGNTAWSSYNLHSDITREGKQASVQWMETVILVKEKNSWKIKILHSTLVKRS